MSRIVTLLALLLASSCGAAQSPRATSHGDPCAAHLDQASCARADDCAWWSTEPPACAHFRACDTSRPCPSGYVCLGGSLPSCPNCDVVIPQCLAER